jgi:hypothetical protein
MRQRDVRMSFDDQANEILIHEDADNDGIVDPGERVRAIETLEDEVVFGVVTLREKSGWKLWTGQYQNLQAEWEGLAPSSRIRSGHDGSNHACEMAGR